MNGFHSAGRDISAHESASTIGKKMANWTEGKSMDVASRTGPGAVARPRIVHTMG